jgi:H3 lysine-79-specific histone-lysine N-methyltransferase
MTQLALTTCSFQLVQPSDPADYNPIEDIIESISHMCEHYFPEKQAEYLTDEITGYPRRFRKAYRELSGRQLLTALDDFNAFIAKSVDDGTIPRFLRTRHNVPLPLVERILSQVYARTVSPQVSILKQYENGTDDVYGELLPRFVHQIFLDTHLRSDQVFVDLGSGVGNVVLQAALEIGCESWGIERMPNPSGLAAKQVAEFVPRCKRWALKPGKATVLQGDFLQSPQIDEVLKRADVILVNNQAFTPTLNQALTMKFLDLKDGCRIVSLRSFLPDNWQIRERNLQDPRNLLSSNLKKEYFSGSVSWTDRGGNYYVATKDPNRLEAFFKKQKRAESEAKESS